MRNKIILDDFPQTLPTKVLIVIIKLVPVPEMDKQLNWSLGWKTGVLVWDMLNFEVTVSFVLFCLVCFLMGRYQTYSCIGVWHTVEQSGLETKFASH